MKSTTLQCVILVSVSCYLHATLADLTQEPESFEGFEKVKKGDPATVVKVEIPDEATVDRSFPRIKFVNGSGEIHDEHEKIAKDGTMISGVAARFGKRSARMYQPYPSHMLPTMNGGNPYYGTRSRYNVRYDNRRNSLDSSSDSISSASPSSWGSKWFNQLKRRTGLMMNPMMSSYERQQQYQNQGTPEEPEMAATFLNGGGGWGQSSHYGKGSVNKSAVGLLGFLSLLSLIQNVINQTSTMTGGRRRREVTGGIDSDDGLGWDDSILEATSLTPYMLPMINVVSNAQNGHIPVVCTLQPICLFNSALVQTLGHERGRIVGHKISETLSKSLQTAWKRWRAKEWDVSGNIFRAGMAGRNGKSCSTLYKSCASNDLFSNPDLSQFVL